MDNLKGYFLISAKKLLDSNFFKTVVLLIEHNDTGAMGLVINRPSDVTIAQALAKHIELPLDDSPVYYGGPVEPGGLIVLHDRADFAENEAVLPGVYVPTSADVFEQVIRSAISEPNKTTFRVYNGCSGWAPGQLEGELERGDWYLLPANSDLIFDEDPYNVWEAAMDRVARNTPLIDQAVENPELN